MFCVVYGRCLFNNGTSLVFAQKFKGNRNFLCLFTMDSDIRKLEDKHVLKMCERSGSSGEERD